MFKSRSEKSNVLIGMASASLSSALFYFLGFQLCSSQSYFCDWSNEYIIALSILLAASTFIFGIARAAYLRFFESNIDGSAPESGSKLDITLRYVTNTSEQLLLFVIAAMIIYMISSFGKMFWLPIAAIWFIIARIMFFIGYHISPTARAFGFAATFYPIIGLFGYAVFKLFY